MQYITTLLSSFKKGIPLGTSLFLMLLSLTTFAQEQTQVADTTVNKTTSKVFKEGAKLVGSNESTWVSIVMIVLVLAVVGVALYLSFRSPNSAVKRKKVLERQEQRRNGVN